MMGNSLPQGKGFLSSYTSHQSVLIGHCSSVRGTQALAGSVFLVGCLVWLLWLWDMEEKKNQEPGGLWVAPCLACIKT